MKTYIWTLNANPKPTNVSKMIPGRVSAQGQS